jgi:hypothetical protein
MLRGFASGRSVHAALVLAFAVAAGSANAQPYPAPAAPAPAPAPYPGTPPPAPPPVPAPYPPPATSAQPAPAQPYAPAPYPAPYPYPAPSPYQQPYYYQAQPAPYPTLPPPAFAPISDLPYAARRAPKVPRPARVFPWRWIFELGGTFELGQVEHLVDGQSIEINTSTPDDHTLRGAFDLRLALQRRFGRWFALAGQLGWTNWQSDYLDNTGRARSNYFSLVVQPELRLPLGKCRRCPALLLAGRAGVALSIRGRDQESHSALEELHVGPGTVYGVRLGLEVPFGDRVSLRFSTGYEVASLRNRVEYQGLGSENLEVRIERPSTTLGLSIGLGDGT